MKIIKIGLLTPTTFENEEGILVYQQFNFSNLYTATLPHEKENNLFLATFQRAVKMEVPLLCSTTPHLCRSDKALILQRSDSESTRVGKP